MKYLWKKLVCFLLQTHQDRVLRLGQWWRVSNEGKKKGGCIVPSKSWEWLKLSCQRQIGSFTRSGGLYTNNICLQIRQISLGRVRLKAMQSMYTWRRPCHLWWCCRRPTPPPCVSDTVRDFPPPPRRTFPLQAVTARHCCRVLLFWKIRTTGLPT